MLRSWLDLKKSEPQSSVLKLKRQKEYEPKTKGFEYFHRSVNAQAKSGVKYITIPLEKAQELIQQMKPTKFQRPAFDENSNSVQSASITLCIPANELVERINSKPPSEYLKEIAELKTLVSDIKNVYERTLTAVDEKDESLYILLINEARSIFKR